MGPLAQSASYLLLASAAYALWQILALYNRSRRSGIRNLPGPPSKGFFHGLLDAVADGRDTGMFERWVREYGPYIRFKGTGGAQFFMTVDTRAISHMLTNSNRYQRPEIARRLLSRALGMGVLCTEGEQHRQQRKIMNPAFGLVQIRELTEVFTQKAMELRDVWGAKFAQAGEKDAEQRIDVLEGLTKMTLDVIGLAGFNYHFDALSGNDCELSRALEVFSQPPRITLMFIARNVIPIVGKLFPGEFFRNIAKAQAEMFRIGIQLVEEKKAAVRREMADEKLGVERKHVVGRDLLSLLIRANMATDIPDNQRLSDKDVLAQVPTFFVAGHETTSNATVWALCCLAQSPEVQRKLRAELLTVDTDTPTMEVLSALPYLDAVVRESLRLHAPITMVNREATEDDIIPVSAPFVDRYGKTQDSIRISAGTRVIIPILAINRSEELWGPDAREFRPERWESTQPESVSSIPGVWAHLMTFLGGPRTCIGYRFALVEMKALLFTLVRAFEYDPAVPSDEILKTPTPVERPLLKSAPEQGCQLPLIMRPVKRV